MAATMAVMPGLNYMIILGLRFSISNKALAHQAVRFAQCSINMF